VGGPTALGGCPRSEVEGLLVLCALDRPLDMEVIRANALSAFRYTSGGIVQRVVARALASRPTLRVGEEASIAPATVALALLVVVVLDAPPHLPVHCGGGLGEGGVVATRDNVVFGPGAPGTLIPWDGGVQGLDDRIESSSSSSSSRSK
jgi:hypothetical protein